MDSSNTELQMPKKPTSPGFLRNPEELVAIVFSCIIALTMAALLCTIIYNNHLYNLQLKAYQASLDTYKNSVAPYKKRITTYLRGIDSSYPILQNGDVTVNVKIKVERDKNARTVGDQLGFYFSVNNKQVKNNQSTAINIVDENILTTRITEHDPSSNDVGESTSSEFITILDLQKGFSVEQTITLREFHGSMRGNTDIYHVTYNFTIPESNRLTYEQIVNLPLHPTMPIKPTPSDTDVSFIQAFNNSILIRLVFIIIVLITIGIIYHQHQITKRDYEKKLHLYYEQLHEYEVRKKQLETAKIEFQKKQESERLKFEEEKKVFSDFMKNKSIRELAGVPREVFFDKNNLPVTKGRGKYGAFTAYITPSGSCFHINIDCSPHTRKQVVHVFEVIKRYKPCSKCALSAITSIPDWYGKYCNIRSKCRYYGIEVKRIES